jgi:SAM-dependent methyltransferase
MMQDNFYLTKEANDFFDRWHASLAQEYKGDLRSNKKSILDILESNLSLDGMRVLEVGSFVSDLLAHLNKKYLCEVYGVETSSKACGFARDLFGLDIENSSFVGSSFFSLDTKLKSSFDLIIFDDVLSWMGRGTILQVVAVADWLLKDGGAIFLRDFSPAFAFAFENHHQKGNGIFNFKHPNGHRQFFLNSGNYFERFSKVYNDTNLQKVKTARVDSSTWADSLIIKLAAPLHPVIEM